MPNVSATDFFGSGTPQPTAPSTTTPIPAQDFFANSTPVLATDNTTIPQPDKKDGILKKIGDFFTGSTQKFGKDIGESAAAPKNASLYDQALQAHTQLVINLQKAIADKQTKGQDASSLISTLNSYKASAPKLEDFTGAIINKTTRQVLGDAAGTGLEALAGGLLQSGAENAVAKGVPIGQKLIKGAKIGATIGAIGGGAQAAQENKSVGDIALESFIGGGVGAGLGAATEGITGGIAKGASFARKALNPTEADVATARKYIAGEYEKALNLTPTQKVKEQTLLQKTGDNVFTTLAKNDINLGSDKAPLQLNQISDLFRTATEEAQKNEHALFNLDEIKDNAFKRIDETIPSETSRNAAKVKIGTEIDAMLQNYNGTVTDGAKGETLVDSNFVERLRKTGNSWTPFNVADPEKVGRSAGYSLSNAVRDQVDKQGTFPAYREANKEWGKIIHAQEVLGKLDASGKNVFKKLGGLSGSIARRILAGTLGYHTAGLGGLMFGELGSEYTAKILSNPDLRTYFDRKIVRRFGNKPSNELIDKLAQQIKDYVDKQEGLLRLPEAGKTSAPVITPAPTTYEKPAAIINNSTGM